MMQPTPADKHRAALSAVNPELPAEDASRIMQSYRILVLRDADADHDTHVLAGTLLNLLPRMFRRVAYQGPSDIHFPTSHANKIRTNLDRDPDLILALTHEPIAAQAGATILYVGNRGWTARLSTERPWDVPPGKPNGITAVYAAALAVGDAFNRAFRAHLERASPVVGTYAFNIAKLARSEAPDYEPDMSDGVELDAPLLVGAGSVGQAFLHALSSVPSLRGLLRIVEHDNLDHGNEQRCVFAFQETRGRPKALAAKDILELRHAFLRVDTPIPALPTVMDYGAYRLATRGRDKVPIVITALDNEQVRRDVQAGQPRVILNAWTETERNQIAYGIGRHTLSGGFGCLTCFHPPRGVKPGEAEFAATRTGWTEAECARRLADPTILTTDEDIEDISARKQLPHEQLLFSVGKPFNHLIHGPGCGLAALLLEGRPVIASVTHVPTLAGSLLAAQFVLEALGRPTLKHLASFDAMQLPTSHQTMERIPDPSCYCNVEGVREEYRKTWPE